MRYGPAGRLLATSSRDRTIRVWDDFEEAARFEYEAFSPWSLAFSPDGGTLAVGTFGQEIHLLDIAREERIGVLRGHHGVARDLVFTRELGVRGLVSASEDGTIKLWDLDARSCVLTLPSGEPVHAVALLGDKRFVSTHSRGTLMTWDLAYYDRHIEGNRAHQERLHAVR